MIPERIRMRAGDTDLQATVRVGRSGPTPAIVNELADQLGRREVVKVRLNRGAISDRELRRSLFKDLGDATSSTLVLQRGNVGVYWKP